MTLREMEEKTYRLIEELSESAIHQNIDDSEEEINDEEIENGEESENNEEVVEEKNKIIIKLTDDPDYERKIKTCINIIQNELARIKKIPAVLEYDVEEGNEYTIPSTIYQVHKIIGCNYELIGNKIIFDEDYKDKVKIYYYKYPEPITEDTDEDKYIFELSQDVLEIMPFGIAGDMLKMDVSTEYGAYFSKRYNELKNTLDTRYTSGSIYIEENIYE